MKNKIKEVLESLLQYEGGEMQSMSESASSSRFNDIIICKAKELEIELDLFGTGRKNYNPINIISFFKLKERGNIKH